MDCNKCSIEMQRLCKEYPASYSCKSDVVAYRKEIEENSGMNESDFYFKDRK